MAAGRKSIVTKDEQEPVVLEGEFAGAMSVMRAESQAVTMAESQHQAQVRAVAAQIGYQLPAECVDPDLIQRDVASNMRRTAESMLQVGLGLICLKAACQHGEFMARLGVLGFEPSVARRYMTVASKLSKRATSHVLLKAIDSQSKLLELIVLDDEQLEEFELTGEIGGLKRDELDSMSVRELRTKVRELRNEVTAKEDVLATRSAQINTLEEKLSRVKTVPVDEVRTELQRESTSHLNTTRGLLIGKFSAAIAALYEHAESAAVEPDVAFVAGLVGQLQADINALRDRFGIPDIAPALIPEWVNDPAFQSLAE